MISFFKQCLPVLAAALLLSACDSPNTAKDIPSTHTLVVKNLSDEAYPDNPDIGFRAQGYVNNFFKKGSLTQEDSSYSFSFVSENKDSIQLSKLNIMEYIPTIPDRLKSNEYLSYISCINQEWNRNQVRFLQGEFKSTSDKITRVDLARNCLNAYLWEIIIYCNEEGKTVPYAHGWFDFPKDLYASLFEQKNGLPFSTYQKPLENWVDPSLKVVDLNELRRIEQKLASTFADSSDAMYPLAGARKKKRKEVIFPTQFATMRALQSDSSLFATFTPPGFYNRKDPRTTELGRIYQLDSVDVYTTSNHLNKAAQGLKELQLQFTHRNQSTKTTLVLGGLNFDAFPVLSPEEANKGWKNAMGISNHTFYEDYTTHQKTSSKNNPYYGLLLDAEGKWIDSHKVGIDGPIFHFADAERTELHLWLLSFERHALVGHYVFDLKA